MECKKCNQGRVNEWRRKNRETTNKQNREYILNKRLKAIGVLGGRCAGCGNEDLRVLQIDHVGGGGNQDRKINRSRVTILNRVISGEVGYQLLCANCHCIKTFDNGEYGNHVSI